MSALEGNRDWQKDKSQQAPDQDHESGAVSDKLFHASFDRTGKDSGVAAKKEPSDRLIAMALTQEPSSKSPEEQVIEEQVITDLSKNIKENPADPYEAINIFAHAVALDAEESLKKLGIESTENLPGDLRLLESKGKLTAEMRLALKVYKLVGSDQEAFNRELARKANAQLSPDDTEQVNQAICNNLNKEFPHDKALSQDQLETLAQKLNLSTDEVTAFHERYLKAYKETHPDTIKNEPLATTTGVPPKAEAIQLEFKKIEIPKFEAPKPTETKPKEKPASKPTTPADQAIIELKNKINENPHRPNGVIRDLYANTREETTALLTSIGENPADKPKDPTEKPKTPAEKLAEDLNNVRKFVKEGKIPSSAMTPNMHLVSDIYNKVGADLNASNKEMIRRLDGGDADDSYGIVKTIGEGVIGYLGMRAIHGFVRERLKEKGITNPFNPLVKTFSRPFSRGIAIATSPSVLPEMAVKKGVIEPLIRMRAKDSPLLREVRAQNNPKAEVALLLKKVSFDAKNKEPERVEKGPKDKSTPPPKVKLNLTDKATSTWTKFAGAVGEEYRRGYWGPRFTEKGQEEYKRVRGEIDAIVKAANTNHEDPKFSPEQFCERYTEVAKHKTPEPRAEVALLLKEVTSGAQKTGPKAGPKGPRLTDSTIESWSHFSKTLKEEHQSGWGASSTLQGKEAYESMIGEVEAIVAQANATLTQPKFSPQQFCQRYEDLTHAKATGPQAEVALLVKKIALDAQKAGNGPGPKVRGPNFTERTSNSWSQFARALKAEYNDNGWNASFSENARAAYTDVLGRVEATIRNLSTDPIPKSSPHEFCVAYQSNSATKSEAYGSGTAEEHSLLVEALRQDRAEREAVGDTTMIDERARAIVALTNRDPAIREEAFRRIAAEEPTLIDRLRRGGGAAGAVGGAAVLFGLGLDYLNKKN